MSSNSSSNFLKFSKIMTEQPTAKNYFFEDFQVDTSRKLLLRLPAGKAIALTHKAFEVLLLLVENRGNLVSKTDLMARVWQDSFVEEANLTQTISILKNFGRKSESASLYRYRIRQRLPFCRAGYGIRRRRAFKGNGFAGKTGFPITRRNRRR